MPGSSTFMATSILTSQCLAMPGKPSGKADLAMFGYSVTVFAWSISVSMISTKNTLAVKKVTAKTWKKAVIKKM